MDQKILIVIAGPTAVGKTRLAVDLAQNLHTEIINADSRQVYREMRIGTAVPSATEQSRISHHFLRHRSIHETYNASHFEQEVIAFLNQWFQSQNLIIMAGGSGLYIDAVCKGIDDLPTIDPEIRNHFLQIYASDGLEGLRERLRKIDPAYYNKVDLQNPKRILKALEVSEMTGKPYSSFLTGKPKSRSFITLKVALDLPREQLHERINTRTDEMMAEGLLDEAIGLYPFRHLNALNTVGYKELFEHISGESTLLHAIHKIKDHTHQYARRQLTWFRRDRQMHWFQASEPDQILKFVSDSLEDIRNNMMQ